MKGMLADGEMYSVEERQAMLKRMQAASDQFYKAAVQIQCHPFIEFAGLMNEYIKMCEQANAKGIDFTQTHQHSGRPLPMETHHARYLGEKLGCIFGPSLMKPDNGLIFLDQLGFQTAPTSGADFGAEEDDGPAP